MFIVGTVRSTVCSEDYLSYTNIFRCHLEPALKRAKVKISKTSPSTGNQHSLIHRLIGGWHDKGPKADNFVSLHHCILRVRWSWEIRHLTYENQALQGIVRGCLSTGICWWREAHAFAAIKWMCRHVLLTLSPRLSHALTFFFQMV